MTRLPNGNVLLIVWDRIMTEEAIAAGRRPEMTGDKHLLPDSLIEIKPTGKTTGEIVWEWHVWDHLIQDIDKSKPNYGEIAEHPELIDINYSQDTITPMLNRPDDLAKLRSLGYIGGGPEPAKSVDAKKKPGDDKSKAADEKPKTDGDKPKASNAQTADAKPNGSSPDAGPPGDPQRSAQGGPAGPGGRGQGGPGGRGPGGPGGM